MKKNVLILLPIISGLMISACGVNTPSSNTSTSSPDSVTSSLTSNENYSSSLSANEEIDDETWNKLFSTKYLAFEANLLITTKVTGMGEDMISTQEYDRGKLHMITTNGSSSPVTESYQAYEDLGDNIIKVTSYYKNGDKWVAGSSNIDITNSMVISASQAYDRSLMTYDKEKNEYRASSYLYGTSETGEMGLTNIVIRIKDGLISEVEFDYELHNGTSQVMHLHSHTTYSKYGEINIVLPEVEK